LIEGWRESRAEINADLVIAQWFFTRAVEL